MQQEDVSSSFKQEVCYVRVVQHGREDVAYKYQVSLEANLLNLRER